jgi:hypothetical protein
VQISDITLVIARDSLAFPENNYNILSDEVSNLTHSKVKVFLEV